MPHCRCVDNIWNVYKTHWAVCHRHKTKWCIGENLISNWQFESEEDWKRNRYRLSNYQTVEPFFARRRDPRPEAECPPREGIILDEDIPW
jgi:hypothetical protein